MMNKAGDGRVTETDVRDVYGLGLKFCCVHWKCFYFDLLSYKSSLLIYLPTSLSSVNIIWLVVFHSYWNHNNKRLCPAFCLINGLRLNDESPEEATRVCACDVTGAVDEAHARWVWVSRFVLQGALSGSESSAFFVFCFFVVVTFAH